MSRRPERFKAGRIWECLFVAGKPLTTAEVAAWCDGAHEQARWALRALCRQGIVQPLGGTKGRTWCLVPGARRPVDRRGSNPASLDNLRAAAAVRQRRPSGSGCALERYWPSPVRVPA